MISSRRSVEGHVAAWMLLWAPATTLWHWCGCNHNSSKCILHSSSLVSWTESGWPPGGWQSFLRQSHGVPSPGQPSSVPNNWHIIGICSDAFSLEVGIRGINRHISSHNPLRFQQAMTRNGGVSWSPRHLRRTSTTGCSLRICSAHARVLWISLNA